MKSFYTLIPRLIKPAIKAGEIIEIEIYISGYGKIEKNKFTIYYSSNLVNKFDAGIIEYNIKVAKDKTTGKTIQPVSGKEYFDTHKLDDIGATITINEGYFLDIPNQSISDHGFPQIMSEKTFDNTPPFRIKINTSTKGIYGDYDIDFALTYSDGEEIMIDRKTLTIHVTRWLERNEKKVTILGMVSAWLSVLLAIILKPI